MFTYLFNFFPFCRQVCRRTSAYISTGNVIKLFVHAFSCAYIEYIITLKAGFHMIATIAEKNSSAIVAIYSFQMIAAIAEKVNEGRGDLRLTHRSRHSSNSTWRLWNAPGKNLPIFKLQGLEYLLKEL